MIVTLVTFHFSKDLYYGCGDGYAFVVNFLKFFKKIVNSFKP